jgi:hypothetical protein
LLGSLDLGDFAREPKGGLLVLPDNSTNLHRELICTLAARHRLPAIYPFPSTTTEATAPISTLIIRPMTSLGSVGANSKATARTS